MDANIFGSLRDIKDNELELMLAWRNSDKVRFNMYNTQLITLSEHIKWYEKISNNSKCKYLMYQDIDLQPTGIVGFTEIDSYNRKANWAFYANPNAPKGTGSKMEFLALEYAFSELNLQKLSCEVLDYNIAVVNLHKKFGFVHEGLFARHHLYEGQFRDVYRLAIFCEKWELAKHSLFEKLLSKN